MLSGANTPLAEPAAKQERTGPGRVFIIDDDRSLLSLLKLIFGDAQFAVHTYLDASKALTEVGDLKPDVIVLDLEMPVMSGREFYKALREDGHNMLVLILSAYGARAAQAELGANASVDKPFEPEDLVEK